MTVLDADDPVSQLHKVNISYDLQELETAFNRLSFRVVMWLCSLLLQPVRKFEVLPPRIIQLLELLEVQKKIITDIQIMELFS